MTTKNITPIMYKFNAPEANVLAVGSTRDNLKDTASFSWQLFSQITGKPLVRIDHGAIEITGADYTRWTGDNSFPFTFVAEKLGLTIAQ